MIRTVEATIDEHGTVRLLEVVRLPAARRALVTILDEEPAIANETTLLSEAALAEDWNQPQEDAAWSHLNDFGAGSLQRTSYVRPGKLFTANERLLVSEVGKLKGGPFERILDAVVRLLRGRAA